MVILVRNKEKAKGLLDGQQQAAQLCHGVLAVVRGGDDAHIVEGHACSFQFRRQPNTYRCRRVASPVTRTLEHDSRAGAAQRQCAVHVHDPTDSMRTDLRMPCLHLKD